MLSLLRKLFATKPAARKAQHGRPRLGLETLEDRMVPSASWTGFLPQTAGPVYTGERSVAVSNTGITARLTEDSTSIKVSLFNSAGGLVRQVAVPGTSPHSGATCDCQPTIAMGGDGSFVVAWTHQDYSGVGPLGGLWGPSSEHVRYQVFDAQGNTRGLTQTAHGGIGFTQDPSVAMNSHGQVAVAYTHATSSSSNFNSSYWTGNICIDRANVYSNGAIVNVGTVAAYTDGKSYAPSVAMNWAGTFAVAWTHDWSSTDSDVLAAKYDAWESPLASPTYVAWSSAREYQASTGIDAWGNVAVAYTLQSGGQSLVEVQRMDMMLNRLGGPIHLTTGTPVGTQDRPSLSMNSYGQIAVAYDQQNSYGSYVFLQELSPAGVSLGWSYVDYETAGWGRDSSSSVALNDSGTLAVDLCFSQSYNAYQVTELYRF